MKTQKTVLVLSAKKAREYFLGGDKYINFDLPHYFTFSQLLRAISKKIEGTPIKNYFVTDKKLNPKNLEAVNYLVFSNKDGEFAWRPFEIIHPVLYVALVHEITKTENWKLLREKFGEFKTSGVVCESIPLAYDGVEGHRARQIKNWWQNVEQRSLEMSLYFRYVFNVDITDCYGALYTHSIAWALHGRTKMKNAKGDDKYLGNRIDGHIRMMRYGQTNGISQGSTLMDFVAEIVLGYVDVELMGKLKDEEKSECAIIRYRDDYKIFTNNPELGNTIVKKLSEVTSLLGMKLNTQKTNLQTDVVLASVKRDKIRELQIPETKTTLSKTLLKIYSLSVEYPNSGLVIRQLDDYYRVLERRKRLGRFDNVESMIGVLTNIAIRNPRAHNYSMAILSKLLGFYNNEKAKKEILDKLQNKFEQVPNTGLLDVWLQRVSYNIDPSLEYNEKLTKLDKLDKDAGGVLWEPRWLKSEIKDIMRTSVINKKKLEGLPAVVPIKEVELFKSQTY